MSAYIVNTFDTGTIPLVSRTFIEPVHATEQVCNLERYNGITAVRVESSKLRCDMTGFWKTLGPGLVWAAAAIGVSHLVQSTRAGAAYGFALVGVVILVIVLKYPFFEFGPRYAGATGESLLDGYRRLGSWAVAVFLLMTFGTMFTVLAVVTVVTASLATQVLGPWLSPAGYSAVLLAVCALILIPGRYPLLDKVVKAIMVVLTLSTIGALVVAVLGGRAEMAAGPSPWSWEAFPFVIALAGWMPSAIDISVWHSLWTLERTKETGYRPRLKEVLLDFNVGYVGTACLALAFLALGAFVLHGRGVELPASGAAFAQELIRVYAELLGSWSRPVIAAAAFTTMFSTTLTVADAFPRVLARATAIVTPRLAHGREGTLYWSWMVVLTAGAVTIIFAFSNRMLDLVDLATTLSFLTAPVLSWLNLRAVTSPHMPPGTTPPPWLRILAWIGLVGSVVFAGVFLAIRFG